MDSPLIQPICGPVCESKNSICSRAALRWRAMGSVHVAPPSSLTRRTLNRVVSLVCRFPAANTRPPGVPAAEASSRNTEQG